MSLKALKETFAFSFFLLLSSHNELKLSKTLGLIHALLHEKMKQSVSFNPRVTLTPSRKTWTIRILMTEIQEWFQCSPRLIVLTSILYRYYSPFLLSIIWDWLLFLEDLSLPRTLARVCHCVTRTRTWLIKTNLGWMPRDVVATKPNQGSPFLRHLQRLKRSDHPCIKSKRVMTVGRKRYAVASCHASINTGCLANMLKYSTPLCVELKMYIHEVGRDITYSCGCKP